MHHFKHFAVVLLMLVTTANAATLHFNSNPLAGDPALTTVGRQIVNGGGGGPVFAFDPATDVLAFDAGVFGVSSVQFANGNTTDPGFPTTGITVAVVQNANAAGAAANALAAQITSPGPGFFVYFNTTLNVPRLVYSTDLDDPTADLAILAQFTNLVGQTTVLPTISASNFAAVPEPSSLLLVCGAFAAAWGVRRMPRQS